MAAQMPARLEKQIISDILRKKTGQFYGSKDYSLEQLQYPIYDSLGIRIQKDDPCRDCWNPERISIPVIDRISDQVRQKTFDLSSGSEVIRAGIGRIHLAYKQLRPEDYFSFGGDVVIDRTPNHEASNIVFTSLDQTPILSYANPIDQFLIQNTQTFVARTHSAIVSRIVEEGGTYTQGDFGFEDWLVNNRGISLYRMVLAYSKNITVFNQTLRYKVGPAIKQELTRIENMNPTV
jgi:hypothetical protein